jgi:hypothetical protein
MNKEFLKLQKIAGLITESEYMAKNQMKEGAMMDDEYPSLDQETYMDFLNACFECFDNGANAYDDSTWTDDERDLAQNLANVIGRAGIDIA